MKARVFEEKEEKEEEEGEWGCAKVCQGGQRAGQREPSLAVVASL